MAGRQNTGICNKLDVAGYLGINSIALSLAKTGVLDRLSAIEFGHLCYTEFWQNVLSLGQSLYARKT